VESASWLVRAEVSDTCLACPVAVAATRTRGGAEVDGVDVDADARPSSRVTNVVWLSYCCWCWLEVEPDRSSVKRNLGSARVRDSRLVVASHPHYVFQTCDCTLGSAGGCLRDAPHCVQDDVLKAPLSAVSDCDISVVALRCLRSPSTVGLNSSTEGYGELLSWKEVPRPAVSVSMFCGLLWDLLRVRSALNLNNVGCVTRVKNGL